MGRSFANLHIKSNNLEKTITALKKLTEGNAKVLGNRENDSTETSITMYISKSNPNESWISVLHDYFVWGTVKKIGKTLSQLVEEPVMTVGYMNEEIFELSFFETGEIQAEKIFCEPWTREEYEQLKEERLNDDYFPKVLDVNNEDFGQLLGINDPAQAVDKLSQLLNMSLWCDAEWIEFEDDLKERFKKYEF
ncbi:hypothetical protein ABE099_20060 [Paenibacillus turicensis]|uniref:hypothetical protein n=1 Tax=Paenibacillus turicensis TaxID=160487 RepID=UPI003D2B0A78